MHPSEWTSKRQCTAVLHGEAGNKPPRDWEAERRRRTLGRFALAAATAVGLSAPFMVTAHSGLVDEGLKENPHILFKTGPLEQFFPDTVTAPQSTPMSIDRFSSMPPLYQAITEHAVTSGGQFKPLSKEALDAYSQRIGENVSPGRVEKALKVLSSGDEPAIIKASSDGLYEAPKAVETALQDSLKPGAVRLDVEAGQSVDGQKNNVALSMG